MAEYPKVPHSHVVPAGYLRAWSQDGRIAMRLVGSDECKSIGVRDAGVRSDFYRRERPSGETTYDVEWSLAEAENTALPVVSSLAHRWPPDPQEKATVGQFFALQHVRGPAFKAWFERDSKPRLAALRAEPARFTKPGITVSPEEAIEEYIEHLESNTYRTERMFSLVRSVGSLLGSMHWTLVRFTKGRLVTSDHPVIVWPLDRGVARPVANDADAGVATALEIFVPISPTHLLLMGWRSGRDPAEVANGSGKHVCTANAFLAANADKQWFHELNVAPWLASGPRSALSLDLTDGYDASEVLGSVRRDEAAQLAGSLLGQPPSNDPIPVLRIE
jgi:hypothetical protein